MTETILKGDELGTLENALFRSAKGISDDSEGVTKGAKDLFSGVYRILQDGKVKAIKKPSFWSKTTAAVSAGCSSIRIWGTQLVTALSNTTITMPLFFLPAGLVDPNYSPLHPWRTEPVEG